MGGMLIKIVVVKGYEELLVFFGGFHMVKRTLLMMQKHFW